jgi:hypothetical protein
MSESGSILPRVKVNDVKFKFSDDIGVTLFGDLPLYKTHDYERAISTWLKSTVSQREFDFQTKFEQTEQKFLMLFDYSKSLI